MKKVAGKSAIYNQIIQIFLNEPYGKRKETKTRITQQQSWDEATKISGKDPDFHRRDLWEAIEAGNFPEWELGVQLVPEEDEFKYEFDLLDPTKLIPEELVPSGVLFRSTGIFLAKISSFN